MSTWQKKPLIIQAFKWTGGPDQTEDPVWIVDAIKDGRANFTPEGRFYIDTLEGNMFVSPGDYIIMGINGEIYPCKPDIFEKSYDRIEE